MNIEELALVRGQIDYKKTSLNDRKEIVDRIVEEKGSEMADYFNNSFKTLTSKDKLSHEDNVSRTLENLANYLLNSDEIKEEKSR